MTALLSLYTFLQNNFILKVKDLLTVRYIEASHTRLNVLFLYKRTKAVTRLFAMGIGLLCIFLYAALAVKETVYHNRSLFIIASKLALQNISNSRTYLTIPCKILE